MTQLQLAQHAAKLAGEAIRNAVPSEGVIQKEGRANIVTAADLASEKIIMDLIKEHFPDDEILSEETESNLKNPVEVDRLWVIDPIDGTNNFRFQRNYSGVSIGYVEKGVLKSAAIYDPFHDELFSAERGKGAFLNGQKISVGNQTELSKAAVATDNSYDPAGTKRNIGLALKISPMPWMQMKGSAVLIMAEVASGRTDLYFHTSLKPWDNAAAFLILEEAGGVIRGLRGEEIIFMSPEIVVGNKELVEQCVKSFRLSHGGDSSR